MAKKIISIFLAALLLIMGVCMIVTLSLSLISICAVGFVYDSYFEYHSYVQGHIGHHYLDVDLMVDYILSTKGNYFANIIICYIATAITMFMDAIDQASVALAFISLAIILLSCIIPKIGNKTKIIGKGFLIASFFGIFASNLVIGFIDSAAWIRTILWCFEAFIGRYAGGIILLIFDILMYTISKIDNYLYAAAAIFGIVYVLATMLSKKAKKEKARVAPKKAKKDESEITYAKVKKQKTAVTEPNVYVGVDVSVEEDVI